MAEAGSNTLNYCKKCSSWFPNQDEFLLHMGQYHSGVNFQCKNCEFSTKDFDEMESHTHMEQDESNEPISRLVETDRKSAFKNRIMSTVFRYIGPTDILHALRKYKERVKAKCFWFLKKHKALRFYISIRCQFSRIDGDLENPETYPITLSSNYSRLLNQFDFDQVYGKMIDNIWERYDTFLVEGSNMALSAITNIQLNIFRYKPIKAGSFIMTPSRIRAKRCVINPQNFRDNFCILYCILIHKMGNEIREHRERISHYQKHLNKLNITGIDFPISMEGIRRLENQNKISINIYTMTREENNNWSPISPLKIGGENSQYELINLLLLQEDDRQHFVYISNFNRLLNPAYSNTKRYYCRNCLNGWQAKHNGKQKMIEHEKTCREENKPAAVVLPKPGNRILKFTQYEKQFRSPLVLYADIECANVELNTGENCADFTKSGTIKKSKHEITGFWIKPVSEYACLQDLCHDIHYTGPGAMRKFYKELKKINITMNDMFEIAGRQEMIKLTPEQEKQHRKAKNCFVCDKPFLYRRSVSCFQADWKFRTEALKVEAHERECEMNDKNIDPDSFYEFETDEERAFWSGPKIYEHDHFSALYRGAAHYRCNLTSTSQKEIPLFLHNMSNYDGHIFFSNFDDLKDIGRISVVAKNLEKFTSFSFSEDEEDTYKIAVKDSLSFLNSPLEKLVQNLKEKADKENKHKMYFKNTYSLFKSKYRNVDEKHFHLLLKKGYFPFKFLRSLESLNYRKVPPKSSFYSDITKEEISQENYMFVKLIWKTFKCKTLLDYHNLYLSLDTNLLADCMEYFRMKSLEVFKLDPAHFISSPGLSWLAALKMTDVQLQLISDIDKILFLDKAMVGGYAAAVTPWARANNKHVPGYDPSKPTTWIGLWDANSLYGWAMLQYLPYANFNWEQDLDRFTPEFITSIPDDSDTGYWIEATLEYPDHLHSVHDYYPLAPEHMSIDPSELSDYQTKLAGDFGGTSKSKKLVCTLKTKKDIILHHANLRQYLKLGLILKKVSKVMSFSQKPWLAKYIETCTELRRLSDSKLDKDFFKLAINAFFGKTLENIRLYSDIRLLHGDEKRAYDKLDRATASMRFNRGKIYSENLVALEMRRLQCVLNKPRYVGKDN